MNHNKESHCLIIHKFITVWKKNSTHSSDQPSLETNETYLLLLLLSLCVLLIHCKLLLQLAQQLLLLLVEVCLQVSGKWNLRCQWLQQPGDFYWLLSFQLWQQAWLINDAVTMTTVTILQCCNTVCPSCQKTGLWRYWHKQINLLKFQGVLCQETHFVGQQVLEKLHLLRCQGLRCWCLLGWQCQHLCRFFTRCLWNR